MPRVALLIAQSLVLGPLLALAGACGGDDEGGTGGSAGNCAAPSCPVDISQFDSTPPVSFETDVLPVFRRSCGLSNSCHGSETNSATQLYLGPKTSDATVVVDQAFRQKIIDGLVGVPSKTAPATSLVVAGNPSGSFLMLKMDGCASAAGLSCTPQPNAKSGDPCGDSMPQGNDVLCADERDTVRRWIAQGANNN